MNTGPKSFIAPLLRKDQLTNDTYSFYFDRKNTGFSFTAGQYIRMILPITATDGRGSSRFFSVSSSPMVQDTFRITTRIIQSDFKKALATLPLGTPVQFFGPLGRFILDEADTRAHIFLAGGIGITPFLSMVPYEAKKKLSIPITLFASFSATEDMVGLEEVTNAARENPAIKVVYTITRPQESQKPWAGETGRISPAMLKKYVQNPLDSLWYIVGPPAMVSAMETIVKELGVEEEQIKKENFTGY